MGEQFPIIQATVGAFSMFLPSIVAVRHHDPNNYRHEKDVRLGLLLGGLWSFVIAMHYAHKESSSRPYMYWLIGAGVMITAYELSLRSADDIDVGKDG